MAAGSYSSASVVLEHPRSPSAPRSIGCSRRAIAEADEFYGSIVPATSTPDEALVMRQALAGMLWSKQLYHFDLDRWLDEHGVHPLRDGEGGNVRNREWFHMVNNDVISMPDTWEYPWYASWDLAFHTVALALVDIDFAKDQLDLMLKDLYLHPSGQLPAYEWNFSDVNPPVHAWATLLVYESERDQRGAGDVAWLEGAFQKLLVNFTWWVNRKDPTGRNVFEGGFLGLDNIGVFDRSAPLPTGGHLEQSDGTAWMAFYAQCMLGIASELSRHDPLYQDMVLKFAEHSLFIAAAMDRIGDNDDEMWDEEDGFFYDVLRLPDGRAERLKVRSIVGLMPLCASTVLPIEGESSRKRWPAGCAAGWTPCRSCSPPPTMPEGPGSTAAACWPCSTRPSCGECWPGCSTRTSSSAPTASAPLSRCHADRPYQLDIQGQRYEVGYLPAESDTGMFGGNSNWRGPVWFPVNYLVLRGLLHLYTYYGDDFTVECPTGSGNQCTLFEVATELGRRLASIFLLDEDGRRPVYGGIERFQSDPHWKDQLLFHEYFHGDNGAGLGASHQTGWTGLVAKIIQGLGALKPEDLLAEGPRGNVLFIAGPAVNGPWPAHPVIYEINTAAWLHDVTARRALRPRWPTYPLPSGTR